MTATLTNTAPAAPIPTESARLDRQAFERTAAIRSATKADDAATIGLDAAFAAGKALWIAPRVATYRPRMLLLPEFDIVHLDQFGDLARALRFAQTELLRRIQRSRQIPGLAAEGWRLRNLLMSYAEALSHKGLIAPELIVRLREGSGYRDLVNDLNVLVEEFLGLPEKYTSPDSAVTRADLDRAAEIAHEIHVHVGNDADTDLSHATLLEERRKLGGLLLVAHGQIRRAITFLRWSEGDVNTLVPSLYVPPGARKTPDVASELPDDLAALHAQLHAEQVPTPVPSDDHPFAAE